MGLCGEVQFSIFFEVEDELSSKIKIEFINKTALKAWLSPLPE